MAGRLFLRVNGAGRGMSGKRKRYIDFVYNTSVIKVVFSSPKSIILGFSNLLLTLL